MLDLELLKLAELTVKQADEEKKKKEKKEEPPGAYQVDRAANVVANDPAIETMARNRREHPFHYLFNPFVRGPITELGYRAKRRRDAFTSQNPVVGGLTTVGGPLNPLFALGLPLSLAGGGAASQQSARQMYADTAEPYDDDAYLDRLATLRDETAAEKKALSLFSPTGPYAMDRASDVVGYDKMLAANKFNRKNNPTSWTYNPLVDGPLRGFGNIFQRRSQAGYSNSPLLASLAGLGGEGSLLEAITDAYTMGLTGPAGQDIARQKLVTVPTSSGGRIAKQREKAEEDMEAIAKADKEKKKPKVDDESQQQKEAAMKTLIKLVTR